MSEGNLIIFCAVKVLVNGQDIGTAYVKWNGFGKGVLPYFIALTSGLTSYGSIGGQEVVRSGRDATETEKEQYGMLFSSILEIDGRIEPIYHYAGVFAYAQLASPSRTWNGPAGPGTFVYSDALDNTWPYEYGGPVAWAGEDGEEYSTTDSPAQGLTDVVNYLVNDWFKMYYMYKADSPFYGLTSDYACLARADWTWFANDTRSNPSAVWPGPTGQTTTLTIPEPRDQIHWTVVVRNVPIGN